MITSTIVVTPPAGSGNGATPPLVGPTGPSAYQVAVAAGYAGTLAQWLASLVGPGPTAAQIQAETQALLGQPTGIAQLDTTGRQLLAQDQIRAWQVRRAAKPALVAAGGAWSSFVALFINTDPDDQSGTGESIEAGAPAPLNGILATQLSIYLVALGQSQAQAQAALQAIWAMAATLKP